MKRKAGRRAVERSQFLTGAVDSIGIANSPVNVAVVVEYGRSRRTRSKRTCKKHTGPSAHTLRAHTRSKRVGGKKRPNCPNMLQTCD